jgi:hypothetical protein
MITYTWDIFKLDCAPSENGLTNVVKTIHWKLTGQDENGITASFNNSYPLPSPSPEAFTDYSLLTKETVVGWLESNLDMGYLQTKLTTEIELQYNPPITSLPLPWVKMEEPVVTEEPLVTEEPVVTEPALEEMIVDGYNPDARDGDGDGLIQDGTQWERPVDTQL